ncbi:MAG: hypothetical protein OXN15_00740 [Chloroflexota bacterium]|nr:hypothetical protein [Chloroflexota bacterium]MDE2970125.1 hypothetical protein [Chloroflexota bacterium]
MTDASNSEWVVVIFYFGLMCVYSFGLGLLTIQALLRLKSRDNRLSYQKWGVDKELFQPNSVTSLIVFGISAIVITILAFYTTYLSTEVILEGVTTNADRLAYTLFFAGSAFIGGLYWEARRVKQITDKIKTLDDLREVFHQRLSPSELLSVYEALSPAPSLFWDEYAGLPADQVSEETNRSFRERAAPYGLSRAIRYNRIAIVVMLVTLPFVAIVPVYQFLS